MEAMIHSKTEEFRNKIMHKSIKIVIFVILIFWATLALFPFVWVLISSFKTSSYIVDAPFKLPFGIWTNENFLTIFEGSLNIWTGYLNSLYISGLVTVMTVLIAYLMAFMLARFCFRGKKVLESLVVAGMMFPAFALLFPIIKILSFLDLYDNQLGVVLPQIALNLGFTTLLLTGFIRSLPKDIEEAAFIDGASMPRVLFGIVLPMVKPAIVTAMIFVFLWSYNDLFLQMIIIFDERKFPISLLLQRIKSIQSGLNWGLMAATVTMVSFPIIVVYLFLQRYIIKGLTAGALKG